MRYSIRFRELGITLKTTVIFSLLILGLISFTESEKIIAKLAQNNIVIDEAY